jgi:hypothetical protein
MSSEFVKGKSMKAFAAQYGVEIDRPMQTVMALVVACAMAMSSIACQKMTLQQWLNTANAVLPTLEAQAVNILQIADPADVALATQVGAGVTAGLKLVSDAVAAYQADPTATKLKALSAALDKVAADLPAILNGIQFANPEVGLAIQAAVTAISVSLDVLAAQLPGSTPTPAAKARMGVAAKGKSLKGKSLTPETLRANWNAQVCDAHPAVAHCPRM